MEAHQIFCHNSSCQARGRIDLDNIVVHQYQPKKRYRCTECGTTFVAHKGTVYEGLRTDEETVDKVLILMNNGCPPRAIELAFELDRRTVRDWQSRAGGHCQGVHQATVGHARLDLQHVQADEIRVKTALGAVWMAKAVMVPTRLWLGGCVSKSRDKSLIQELMFQVRACAGRVARPILVCVDGLAAYPKAIRRAFSEKIRNGKRGRPRLCTWRQLVIGQVVKRYQQLRVIAIETRVAWGCAATCQQLLEQSGCQTINTAIIERFNATMRGVIPSLVRRTRGLDRKLATLEHGMFVVGCMYNFCWRHQTMGGHTPAMADGITDHQWRVRQLFCYVAPPPLWQPPKRRGKPQKAFTP